MVKENKNLSELVNNYEDAFNVMRQKEIKFIKLLLGIRKTGVDIE